MKAIKITLICILSLAFILYILLPVGFGLYASFEKTGEVGLPPDGFNTIQLLTEDGIQLKAWYKSPENGAVILVLHGANSSRDSVRSHAQMLSDNGFGVLALDLRGHGESKGGGNSFGWNSTRDVGAVMLFLKEQTDVKMIGGLGLSIGGEALLGALSTYPQVRAVIADGATQRSIKDYLVLPARQGLVRSWSTRVMYAAVGFFTGDTPPARLVDSIIDAKETRLLLIAAGGVKSEIEYNEYFQNTAGNRAELWVVPGSGHTGAYNLNREEYEHRVIKFFYDTLVQDKE
ncbi:MAG TPA: alpha/beta fold hydrolase [Anaerovoracaceae bacterium]|nr:alpha/beta fold hydrolase [Anaerovoracaceae bacterium]HYE68332.1 alpha/beta fold hydrolase [Anaerovoracaceae bacterium]